MARTNDDLWKAYASTLKKDFLQGADIGPSNRIYIPPINSTAILAGATIGAATTSYGVARSGDALVDINNPLYTPSNEGYALRCLSYLQAVQLQSNASPGLQQVLELKFKRLTQFTTAFLAVQRDARAAWKESGDTTPFTQWATQNFPAWSAAASQRDAAAMDYNQAQTQVAGPGFLGLKKAIDNITLALEQSQNSYNMPVNRAIIGTASDTATTPDEFRPKYDFDQSYASQVQGWINMAGNPTGTFAKKTIVIDGNSMRNASWTDAGFDDSSVRASAGWLPFFSVDYSQSDSKKHEEINVSEAGSSLTVKITADAIQPFNVNPSSIWNPGNIKERFPELLPNASKHLFDPIVQVSTLIIGYNVSTAITVDDSTFNKITNHVETAKSVDAGASASLFGFRLNLGGQFHSDEQDVTDWNKVTLDKNTNTIIIPGANDTVPVLMAVIGQVIG